MCMCTCVQSYFVILWFLTCVSHTAHVIGMQYAARLSVCPSVTRWYCVETAQPIIKLSSLHAW